MHTPRKYGENCNSLVWTVLEEIFPSSFISRTHKFQFVVIGPPLDFCIKATKIPISISPMTIACTNFCAMSDLPLSFHCARSPTFGQLKWNYKLKTCLPCTALCSPRQRGSMEVTSSVVKYGIMVPIWSNNPKPRP